MVGIDIVDHSDPLLRPRDSRALRLIRHSDDSMHGNISGEQLFWLYWAAKESTFKAYRQLIRFNPKAIEVQIIENGKGLFTFKSESISGKIIQNEKTTLSICGTMPLEDLIFQSFESKIKEQSIEIRRLMIDFFDERGISITISRDALGLPVTIFPDGDKLTTFTHHHHQMAFICQR